MRYLGTRFVMLYTLVSIGVAQAQTVDPQTRNSDFYVGGAGAVAFFAGIEGAEYEIGGAVSGFIGLELGPNWRTELELSYESAEFENSADATSFFRLSGNLYRDFEKRLLGDWTLYAGGGAGIVNIDVGNDEDNTELSAHVETGFSIPINDQFDFVPGLRAEYIALENIDDQIITQLRAGLHLRP